MLPPEYFTPGESMIYLLLFLDMI